MGPEPTPNTRLRHARVAIGWTQADVAAGLRELAEELGEAESLADANQVSKWERGTRHPGLAARARLCLLLDAPPRRLGWTAGPALAEEIRGLRERRAERQRRASGHDPGPPGSLPAVHKPGSELPDSITAEADRERLGAALRHLWPCDATLVDGLARAGATLSRRADIEPPPAVLPDLHSYVGALTGLLSRTQPAGLGGRLQVLASMAACHIGQLSDVTGRWSDTYIAFALADALARDAGDNAQLALALGWRASVLRRHVRGPEQLPPATSLAQAAELVTDERAPSGIAAWGLSELAIHAAMGDRGADAERYMDRALRVAADRPHEMNICAPDLPSAWLARRLAEVKLELGQVPEAVVACEHVLSVTAPELTRERARAMVYLARAWAMDATPERACGQLLEVVQLAMATDDNRSLALAETVARRDLGPWGTSGPVRQVREAIREARQP